MAAAAPACGYESSAKRKVKGLWGILFVFDRCKNMGLNIKNDETYRLVEELVKLTGETLTGAVTQAVRERRALADRLLRIGKDCAARLKEPFRSADHGDLLYDERCLPRRLSTPQRWWPFFAPSRKRKFALAPSRAPPSVASRR